MEPERSRLSQVFRRSAPRREHSNSKLHGLIQQFKAQARVLEASASNFIQQLRDTTRSSREENASRMIEQLMEQFGVNEPRAPPGHGVHQVGDPNGMYYHGVYPFDPNAPGAPQEIYQSGGRVYQTVEYNPGMLWHPGAHSVVRMQETHSVLEQPNVYGPHPQQYMVQSQFPGHAHMYPHHPQTAPVPFNSGGMVQRGGVVVLQRRNNMQYINQDTARDGEESCPICLCDIEEGAKIGRLRCCHLGHYDCMQQVAEHSDRNSKDLLCPVCRLPTKPC